MVKFPGKKKSKKDKEAPSSTSSSSSKKNSEAVSPLMADEPKATATSSRSNDSALKEEQRAKARKERDERRGQRDKRIADSKASKSSSSDKKKKSKPKLSVEEQLQRDSNLGCCHKFAQFLAKFVHLIDGIIGLAFVVYGCLLKYEFEEPAAGAVDTTLAYGSTLLITSILGASGFATSFCSRVGLVISAYIAPFIAFFYIFVIIAMLSSGDLYWDYVTEHKDVLYLNDSEIATLKQIMPFIYIVLASLAAVEVCRFFGVRKIRETLLRHDAANKQISSNRSKKSSSSSNGNNLTEPLIDRDEEVGRDSSDEDSGFLPVEG